MKKSTQLQSTGILRVNKIQNGLKDLPTTEQPAATTETAMEIDPNVMRATLFAGDILESAPKAVVVPVITGLEHEKSRQ